jgi:hypothetical protein
MGQGVSINDGLFYSIHKSTFALTLNDLVIALMVN